MHIIMDIGCLECGAPTNLVAVFSSFTAACRVQEALEHRRKKARDHDHEYQVFTIPYGASQPIVVIMGDYTEAVEACNIAYMEL